MSYPETLQYSPNDVWLGTANDGAVSVGLTTQAVRYLTGNTKSGSITAVKLPAPGAGLAANGGCGAVQGSQTVSALVCPIAGTVLAVNRALAHLPNLLRDDPYGAGWLFKFKPNNATDLNGLMNAPAYAAFAGQQWLTPWPKSVLSSQLRAHAQVPRFARERGASPATHG